MHTESARSRTQLRGGLHAGRPAKVGEGGSKISCKTLHLHVLVADGAGALFSLAPTLHWAGGRLRCKEPSETS